MAVHGRAHERADVGRLREPDVQLTGRVAKACHAQGVVVLTAGTFGNVLRFLLPLVVEPELLAEGMGVLEAAFDDFAD